MAVLSHAMMFIASLFAAPIGSVQTDTVACHSVSSWTQAQQAERTWVPSQWARAHETNLRTFGALRMRGVASLRAMGRCVVKPAPDDAQPVLFGSFATPVDDPDDENLLSSRSDAAPPFERPASVGTGPTEMYVLRAPLTQLERPPRV